MLLVIHIVLLLFALGSSHTLSRMQIANGPDIYQIRDKPNNMIEIIEPKPKLPTLREIIYFKIKEKPYINNIEKENSTKLLRRKRESNYNVLKNMVSQDDRGESNLQDVKRPNTYGFHLNNNKGFMWNHLPFIYQENNINDPSNIINKENNEEYQTDNSPDSSSEASNSESDDNSLYSDNDSGYNAEPEEEEEDEEEEDQSSDETPTTSANRPDQDNQEECKKPSCTVTNNFNQCNMEQTCDDKYATKTEESTNSPIQKDNETTPVVPECSIENQSQEPTKCNNLSEPNTERLNKDQDNPQERKKPSCTATNNSNQCNMEPTCADKCATKIKELTNWPFQKDREATPEVPECSNQNQSQKPTKFKHLNESDKESLNKDKDNSDNKKDYEPVEVVLDKIIKKDEFRKWLKKWTTPYERVLKEHVAELVNKEVAKHVNKTMNHQNVKRPAKCNNLSEPNTECLNKDQDNQEERKKPSCIVTNNFNQCNMEPTCADKCATKIKESINSPLQKDKETTPVFPECSIQNQSQKHSQKKSQKKNNHLNKPDKESLNKDKDNSKNKKANETSEVVLDEIIKKDEFRKWLRKWTTPYVRVLKQHVAELVNKEVAKHVNKTMNHQNVKEKDKIDTNKNNDTAAPADTTANKTSPADTAANKTAPADTAANKTAPADTAANKTAPADTAANKTAPSNSAANKTAPADAAANKMAPTDTTANKTAPSDSAANKTTPADTAANKTAPSNSTANKTAPADTMANKTDPADPAANKTTPADTAANKTALTDTAANKMAPSDSAANKTAPADTAANKTALADSAANKTDPADTAANKTAPANTAANKTAPAETAANKTAPANTMSNKK